MSCRDICRYAQHCMHSASDIEPERCANYYRLEDYSWDAECSRQHEYQDEDELPFTDFDGEEEEEAYAEIW